MHLRDHMDDAVGGAAVDLHQLVREARREGMGLRRCRQALTTVGGATTLTARPDQPPAAGSGREEGPSAGSRPTSTARA